jgi:hypothetical protein
VASLQAMREALAKTIGDNIEGLIVYDTLAGATQVPAVIVLPTPRPMTADFTGAFQRGMDTWFLDIFVLVGVGEYAVAQNSLDDYLTGAGPNSIRQVLYQNPTCGLADTDFSVTGVSDYGGKHESADVDHIGAVLKVTARTSGSG